MILKFFEVLLWIFFLSEGGPSCLVDHVLGNVAYSNNCLYITPELLNDNASLVEAM